MLADKAHTVKKRKIIVLFSLLIFFQNIANTFALGEVSSYEGLRGSWNEIFPDGNRNAAGAKFFKYILEKENNFEKFTESNKLYCAVSGSLIKPGKNLIIFT